MGANGRSSAGRDDFLFVDRGGGRGGDVEKSLLAIVQLGYNSRV